MAEGLTRKRRIRAGHRGSATKILQKVDGLMAGAGPGDTIDTLKLAQLNLSLQEKLETLKQLDNEILELTEEGDLVNEIEQADSFKEGIYEAIARIEKLRVTTPTTPSATPTAPRSTERTEDVGGNRVKLPKLTLKPFNGDITTWTTFWDSYESAIHNNEALSDIDKFNYLKSLLERAAREAISGLTLTSANYHEAISILKKRFGNKQQIISRHMDVLLNAEPVLSQHNLKGLRHLYDQIESHVRSLKSLGVSSESYGSLLSSVLLSKLPQELRLIISRKTSEDDWSLDNLMKEMEQEIEARERALASPTSPNQQGRRPIRDQHTASALLSGTTNPCCCYCRQAHSSDTCRIVTQVDARKEILRKSGRCFICLRRGHIGRECRSRSKCSKCCGRHHFTICSRMSREDAKQTSPAVPTIDESSVRPVTLQTNPQTSSLNPNATSFVAPPTTSMYVSAGKTVLLQTARVLVYNPDAPQSSLEIRAVLDTGSQRSYVTNQVKDALALKPEGEQCMSIISFGSDKRNTQRCEVVKVGMKMRDGTDKEFELFTVPLICESLTAQPIAVCVEKYDHLARLELADFSDGKTGMDVDLLVGADYYWELITGTTRRGKEGPVAIHTKVGWVLSGPAPSVEQDQQSTSLITTHTLRIGALQHDLESLDETLQSFWDLESLGIKDPDRSVFTEFEESIKFSNDRYEVSLPWKDPHPALPDNYQLCLKRLHGLLCRLRQDPATLKEYDSIIRDQIKQGIVELVEDPEATEVGEVHYLPHHAVIRKDKETTKLRIVYDASAKSNGPSLNNCLYTGPKFDQRIMDILLRFRSYRVGLIADIEKAFLMVSMSKKDRDVLRFLWIDDIDKDQPEVHVLRFTRVVFGVSSSPFLLNATIGHHLKKYSLSHPQLVENLSRSIYVDDVVSGAENDDEAYQLCIESKRMLKTGGFNLRKFVTNSNQLQEKIDSPDGSLNKDSTSSKVPTLEETYTKTTLGNTHNLTAGEQKVLGVRWNVAADHLVLDVNDIVQLVRDLEPTKKHIVSIVGRFYDPLGFLSPVVIRFKILFQQLCAARLNWDQALSGELLSKWKSLISGLQGGLPISIPRCFLDGVSQEVQAYSLHGFCDASKSAYAAVIYMVIKTATGHFVKFVASKTRVSPIHKQTIPRLELLSALLLAKLMTSVSSSLDSQLTLSQPTCYTDSRIALYWILGSDKEWKQFVQNRVSEIRKLLPTACWKHCSSQDNPADLPSRGLTLLELSASKLWWNGPGWLKGSEITNFEECIPMPEECLIEMKTKDRKLLHSLLVTEGQPSLTQIMDCQTYSSIHRLLRVTARVLSFVNILKERVKHIDPLKTSTLPSVREISNAEMLWVKEVQLQLVKDFSFESWKKQFNLFLDPTGVWRCGGRLSNADIPYSAKHPILLPKHHHLVALIVKRAHERVFHNGVKETLTEIRSKYWILKGRSFVKMIIRQCVICRKFEGKPFLAPPPPPLPEFRVQEKPPFTYTGVDFAGPLYIKSSEAFKESKVWICLYTCCIVRAIHLDIVPDMTTSSFLRSFKRFTARRGLPQKIVSDNGKTFKAAAKAIKAVMSHEEVQRYLSGIGIEWSFNIEKAPWWGGFFERMVRSTKRCLKKMIGRAKLSYDELLTAVIEVEMIINSRPLSYISSDDIEEPLTPAHFLTGRRTLSVPDSLCCGQEADDDVQITPAQLNKRMRHLNTTLNQFWKRWKEEYLLELREFHRYSMGNPEAVPISVGDIVLIHDDKPRGFWRMARVQETVIGRDGHTRGAVLRVAGKNHPTVLQRPLQRLYPLEINCCLKEPPKPSVCEDNICTTENEGTTTDVADQDGDKPEGRPKRASALRARDGIKAWTTYEMDCD